MATDSLVGPSREGDQFHYHWAARQCLPLLGSENGLILVTIEGASAGDSGAEAKAGEELIDVGLYYGGETVEQARLVRFVQLKHSTRRIEAEWTASGLKGTLKGFASRYSDLHKRFSAKDLAAKLRFEFTTNRPISSGLLQALAELKRGIPTRLTKLHQLLISYTGLGPGGAAKFFALLAVNGRESSLWAQRQALGQDINRYLPGSDSEARLQLKELVTRKATTEFAHDPGIRKVDVLHALGTTEQQMNPAPNLMELPPSVLARDQEDDVLAAILSTALPVVILADGGVGKSVLVLRLASRMPASHAVVFDCFGNGTYRSLAHVRHRPADALVQIANELAIHRLCDPLVPSTRADTKQYFQAFEGRLQQAIGVLRARDPSACLCIFVDAADNAQMAAEEHGDPISFVQTLIRLPVPAGVRLVFTCRPYRQHLLDLPPDVCRIELSAFSHAESSAHLRSVFPEATDAEAVEFAYLSSANPRVQSLALASHTSLPDLLAALGPTPSTVERTIKNLLQRTVDRVRDLHGPTESAQFDDICRGLAVLRPLVPLRVLAAIAGVSVAAVRSFATDLGRPLFIRGDSLHFIDEPSETWFRDTFLPDTAGLKRFLARLRPFAADSAYVASTLPQLLLQAREIDELVALALSTHDLPMSNPLERRDVELQRLRFALKVCLEKGRYRDAGKLALKAAGEVAGEDRQIRLIQQNTHVAAAALAPDRTQQLVARRTFAGAWPGAGHAYNAGLLSMRSEHTPEAQSHLRMAMDWLWRWARAPVEDREKTRIGDDDRAQFAMAQLRLRGANAAVDFLACWRPPRIVMGSAQHLAKSLVDIGEYTALDSLAEAAGGHVWLTLGLVGASAKVGHRLPAASLDRVLSALTHPRAVAKARKHVGDDRALLDLARFALAHLAYHRPDSTLRLADILRLCLPNTPPHMHGRHYGRERAPLWRAYALEAALRGRTLELHDVADEDMRKSLSTQGGHGHSSEASTFKEEVGARIPWYLLAAEVSIGRVPQDLPQRISAALGAARGTGVHDREARSQLIQDVAVQWLSILRDANALDDSYLGPFRQWLDAQAALWTTTQISLCRIAARVKGLEALALRFSQNAAESLATSREDAESRAKEFVQLAKAIYPLSQKEAIAFFDQAIDIASRLGDDSYDRWTALVRLAQAARQAETPQPETAYRFARAAELIQEYSGDYFRWDEIGKALVGLGGASAITILSRWRDRRFGDAEELLSTVAVQLVEENTLAPAVFVALKGFLASRVDFEDVERALRADTSPTERGRLLLSVYRYLRLEDLSPKDASCLAVLGHQHGISLLDIERLQALPGTSSSPERGARSEHEPATVAGHHSKLEEVLSKIDVLDASALHAAFEKRRSIEPFVSSEEFFRLALQRAGVGRAPELVQAVEKWPDLAVYDLRALLTCLFESPSPMLSLKKAIRDVVLGVCRQYPHGIRRSSVGESFPFERLTADGSVSTREIYIAQVEGHAAAAEVAGARQLFSMIEPLAGLITPPEAEEVLKFGLDLLEPALRAEDGDGGWQTSLTPPEQPVDALAGYLWAGLGSPGAADRWRFAHVVRTLVELDCAQVLVRLLECAVRIVPGPFVDAGLTFYAWHAKQWMLVGLARGALERPRVLLPFVPYLRGCLAEEHVLIRAFAAEALRAIGAFDSRYATSGLDEVNRPALPIEVFSGWHDPVPDVDDEEPGDESNRYSFGIDIGPYWFSALGQVFGLTEVAIARRARRAIRDFMGKLSSLPRDDARYKRGIFYDHEASHSHGSMPRTDDLQAYSAYHAMMIVAADLLKTLPVRHRDGDDRDEFAQWFASRGLTRRDGQWAADLRDPRLIREWPRGTEELNTWCWEVGIQDLDQLLWTDDGRLTLWGHWTDREARAQTSDVRSALVEDASADALCAALQTASDLDRFPLPYDGDYDAPDVDGFRLQGWVNEDHNSLNLDEEDPWAAGINCPGPAPSRRVVETLALIPSLDLRRWTAMPKGDLRSESWGEIVGFGRERESVRGSRLSADAPFVASLLAAHPGMCLVVSSKVRRTPPKRSDSEFERFPMSYCRYYLVHADGVPRAFSCNPGIGEAPGRAAPTRRRSTVPVDGTRSRGASGGRGTRSR
jgi:hypothetical protein